MYNSGSLSLSCTLADRTHSLPDGFYIVFHATDVGPVMETNLFYRTNPCASAYTLIPVSGDRARQSEMQIPSAECIDGSRTDPSFCCPKKPHLCSSSRWAEHETQNLRNSLILPTCPSAPAACAKCSNAEKSRLVAAGVKPLIS